MNSAERGVVLHCLKSMIDEAVCEECPLYGTTGTDHCEKDCVRLAINALEQVPCTDAISRQAVLNYIRDNYRRWFINDEAFMQCVNGIKDIISVTPAEKVGHWEWNQYDSNPKIGNFHCSQCHGIGKSYYDYCPYCKAKMLASPTGEESED